MSKIYCHLDIYRLILIILKYPAKHLSQPTVKEYLLKYFPGNIMFDDWSCWATS